MRGAVAIAVTLLAVALPAVASARVVDLAAPADGGAGFFGGAPRAFALANVNAPGTPLDAIVTTTSQSVTVGITSIAGQWGLLPPPANNSIQTASLTASPTDLTVGDVNGDGRPDIAISHGNGVSVMTGSSMGVYSAAVKPDASLLPASGVALASIDAGTLPDLVASVDGAVQVYSHNGSTSFISTTSPYAAAANYFVDGPTTGVGTGDFDVDGDRDVAVATAGVGAERVVVLVNGGGLLTIQKTAALFSRPKAVAVADVKGDDGRPEILVTEPDRGTVAIVATSNMPTSLGPIERIATGLSPVDVAAGDLDGDGRSEIVTANGAGDSVTVAAPGEPPRTFPAGAAPAAVAIGEVTGDSLADVVVANDGSQELTVLRNLGVPPAPPTGPGPTTKPKRGAKLSCKRIRKRGRVRGFRCTVKLTHPGAATRLTAKLRLTGKRKVLAQARVKPGRKLVLRTAQPLADGRYRVALVVANRDKTKIERTAKLHIR